MGKAVAQADQFSAPAEEFTFSSSSDAPTLVLKGKRKRKTRQKRSWRPRRACKNWPMFDQATSEYVCPFCRFVQGNETPSNTRGDVVYQDDSVMAFVAPRWWPNNPGNVIVIPVSHHENIYNVPNDILSRIIAVAKRLAIAIKEVYRCDGTSLRQHNESGGGQDVFHFHLHVFPRYVDDQLYQRTDEHRFASQDERHPYAQALRTFLEERAFSGEAASASNQPCERRGG